eukprot:TRINITY_DN6525_c0_g1_i1.p1 TRINITY_DN6525_c0_g1~~TRINITY_DN6525_c0_g1_i1.p1  ORF type:complete len:465 (+),score=88.28 TRINITY_DN6525_c0_g1_i1:91-1485(+)
MTIRRPEMRAFLETLSSIFTVSFVLCSLFASDLITGRNFVYEIDTNASVVSHCSPPFLHSFSSAATAPLNDHSCWAVPADCFPPVPPPDAACFPSIFLIGAPKSATTSLFSFLAQHPRFCAPTVKEPNYFVSEYKVQYSRDAGLVEKMLDPREQKSLETNYSRSVHMQGSAMIDSLQGYMHTFPSCHNPATKHCLTGEATTNYLSCPSAASRIHNEKPSKSNPIRIIAVLRDPVERYVSHYNMLLQWIKDLESHSHSHSQSVPFPGVRKVLEPISKQVDADLAWIQSKNLVRVMHPGDVDHNLGNSSHSSETKVHVMDADLACRIDRVQNSMHRYALLEKGIYIDQLIPWYRQYGPNNVMLLRFEDLINAKTQPCLLHRVLQFVGLEAKGTPINPHWSLPHENEHSKSSTGTTKNVANLDGDRPGSGHQVGSVDEHTIKLLREFYSPFNARLAASLGRDLGWGY